MTSPLGGGDVRNPAELNANIGAVSPPGTAGVGKGYIVTFPSRRRPEQGE